MKEKYEVYQNSNNQFLVVRECGKEMEEVKRFDNYKEAVKFKHSKMAVLWRKLAGSTQENN